MPRLTGAGSARLSLRHAASSTLAPPIVRIARRISWLVIGSPWNVGESTMLGTAV